MHNTVNVELAHHFYFVKILYLSIHPLFLVLSYPSQFYLTYSSQFKNEIMHEVLQFIWQEKDEVRNAREGGNRERGREVMGREAER